MKTLGFLQSSSGENSSRRLAFLSGHLSITVALFWICGKLIGSKHPEIIIQIVNSYFVYCAFLGGYVTADLFIKIIEIVKNAKSQNNSISGSDNLNDYSEFSEGKEQRTNQGN